ncbi:hypothetical protein [Halorarius halobius]|uniref:hypothetical protein n=1 Tax=Halorarius halobius TaxID=2962671 RepID=UPI0020CE24E3|nr:hypothetical protein [Halorarius halobius]
MRQLSGCDFCGGTASGTFEVLPPEHDPEGDGKRMLLCDHCRDALASILDPLLDSTGAADVEPRDVEPEVGATGAPADGADPDDGPVSATEATGDPGRGDAVDAGDDASDSGPDADAPDAGADSAESDGAADPGDAEMASTGAGSSSRVPKGYRKVLRFLENREFPIERTEAVEMTADAYGLDEEAVDAAIEHAVSHGRLKAYDGELRRA